MEEINKSPKTMEDFLGMKDLPIEEKVVKLLSYVIGSEDESKKRMLVSALSIYKRMSPVIENLDYYKQYEIVFQTTMIAYEASTNAYDHIIEYTENLNKKP